MNYRGWYEGCLKQVRYTVRHKWFVFLECWKLGIPWLGVVHDLSKFRLSEFLPYARYFRDIKKGRDKVGYYKPYDTGDAAFEYAFYLHVRRNKHHWQSWVIATSPATLKAVPIPEKYIWEMVADWRGAGRAQGTPDTLAWYKAHKNDLMLHPESRKRLEQLIGYYKEDGLTDEEQGILEERFRAMGHM